MTTASRRTFANEPCPTLSIVIPCYNERHTIESLLDAARSADIAGCRREIVVVDDGSDDGTRELLRGPLAERIDVLRLHHRNRGKGAALRTGFEASSGDILLVQDADREYDPRDYAKLLRPILEGSADVVFGSRFANGVFPRVGYPWQALGNRLFTAFSNALTTLELTDVACGHKVFRRATLGRFTLEEDGFAVDAEVAAKIGRLDLAVGEVGVSYRARGYAEGKKLVWRDGLRAVYATTKYSLR